MSHGGAREGAGRKPGIANARTREIADKAAAEGLTPLEYLIDIMRKPYPEVYNIMPMGRTIANRVL